VLSSLGVLKKRMSAERLALSCVVLRERSDRGPRQLQGLSYTAFVQSVSCKTHSSLTQRIDFKCFPPAFQLSHASRESSRDDRHLPQGVPEYQRNTRNARSVFHRLGRPSPSSIWTGITPG
jgi:hypothetical protein